MWRRKIKKANNLKWARNYIRVKLRFKEYRWWWWWWWRSSDELADNREIRVSRVVGWTYGTVERQMISTSYSWHLLCFFVALGFGGSSFTTSPTHWLTTDIGKKVNQFAGFQWCLLKFLKTFICLPLLKFSHTFALISALAVSRHQQPPKKAPLLFGATERLLRECDFQRHFLSFDVFAFSNGNRALALQMLSRAHVKNHIHSNGKKSNYVFCVMWIDKFNIEYISFGFLFIPFLLLSFCFIFEFFFLSFSSFGFLFFSFLLEQ